MSGSFRFGIYCLASDERFEQFGGEGDKQDATF